ncbi:glutathione peroxidase [Geofilum rhodophaeum]|uniref:glutathione peroxidase n=1 Tax=Geofilum rhodophaeum TaxID=1965019 RepID=UPI00197AFDDF|nr:glutathione peroxidase [Geofilum rhodophaeum]
MNQQSANKKWLAVATLMLLMASLATMAQSSFYDFKVKTLQGQDFDFDQLRGKKVMIVNTASKCGLTGQYEQLQELWETYGGDDFVIIGFPANNFMNQEPGTADEIAEFCQLNYGVSFPLMEKISVKGDDQHPLYEWLTSKELNGVEDSKVQWNFQKYLISAEGQLVKVIAPRTLPNAPEVIDFLTE